MFNRRSVTGIVALPDNDAAAATIEHFSHAAIVLRYKSNRPMIVGDYSHRMFLHASCENKTAAMVGYFNCSAAQLTASLAANRCNTDWDSFVTATPGEFHLIVATGTELLMYGTAAGVCRVFQSEVSGSVVLSDRSLLLAQLSDAPVDPSALACRLLEPVPHSLAERGMWIGVTAIAPDNAAHIDHQTSQLTTHRWHTFAQGTDSLERGAKHVRTALVEAVQTRLGGQDWVSAEMSGGYDSTSISFIAARNTLRLITHTIPSNDSASEDVVWAKRAASFMPQIEHDVLPVCDLPLFYDQMFESLAPLDEPSIALAGTARLLAPIKRLQSRGVTLNLTGHGGDQLFAGVPNVIHDSVRRHPIAAVKQAASFRALAGWTWRSIARSLMDSRTYQQWWLDQTGSINPTVSRMTPTFGWSGPMKLAPWVTADAKHAITTQIRDVALQPSLGRSRGENAALEAIYDGSRMVRIMNQLTSYHGVPSTAPYYDDTVVSASLAVDPTRSVTASAYKPLLREAMREIVPTVILDRSTKDDGSMDLVVGSKTNRDVIQSLWTDSRLATYGLIDEAKLSAVCANSSSPELADGAIWSTLSCELWLRGLETSQPSY